MKTLSTATAIALALTAGSALAADLPSKKAPPVYVAPAPVFTWTGFYGGANIGYAWNENQNLTGSELFVGTPAVWNYRGNSVDGVIGGGQVGYNYQFAGTGFVVGVEADFQGAGVDGDSRGVSNAVPGGRFAVLRTRQTLDWFGTVRGRLGYAILPNLLVYGTGGFAYGEGSSRFTYWDTLNFWAQQTESDSTRTGWTAGGGVEWAFLPNWSAKVEYLYVDLGRSPNLWANQFNGAGAQTPFAAWQRGVDNRFHTVKVGLNYHFNLFGAPAPVVAKY